MSILSRITLSLLIGGSFFASCKKATEKTTTANTVTTTASSIGTFTSTGSSVVASGASGAKISISATSSTGASFLVWLDPYSGTTGTYSLNDDSHGAEWISANNDTTIVSAHGTLILTAVTPNVVGSFVFTGRDSVVYTGAFSVVAP